MDKTICEKCKDEIIKKKIVITCGMCKKENFNNLEEFGEHMQNCTGKEHITKFRDTYSDYYTKSNPLDPLVEPSS